MLIKTNCRLVFFSHAPVLPWNGLFTSVMGVSRPSRKALPLETLCRKWIPQLVRWCFDSADNKTQLHLSHVQPVLLLFTSSRRLWIRDPTSCDNNSAVREADEVNTLIIICRNPVICGASCWLIWVQKLTRDKAVKTVGVMTVWILTVWIMTHKWLKVLTPCTVTYRHVYYLSPSFHWLTSP